MTGMMTVNSGYDKAFGKAYQAPSYGAVTPFNMQPQQQSIMPVRGYQTPPQYGGAQPAAWEVAEFGGNPLYSNYKQALPMADMKPSGGGAINGTDVAEFKKSGLPFEVWLEKRFSPPSQSGPSYGLTINQSALDKFQKEREAKALKEKLAGASPISTAPVPVFGNTRQKDVGYWGIRGY